MAISERLKLKMESGVTPQKRDTEAYLFRVYISPQDTIENTC